MIYSSIIQAKTGEIVPIFTSGKIMHSKYNPQKEAESQLESITKKDIFFVEGLGGAFIPLLLRKKFNDSIILIAENSNEDIEFIKQNCPQTKTLFNDEKTIIFPKNQTESIVLKNFIPAKFSTFEVIETRSWVLEVNDEQIKKDIQNAIKKISMDFSVQAHFGKLWTHNIIQNLKIASKIEEKNNYQLIKNIPTEKKAIIVAAGPSLDKKIDYLKNEENIFIIATDTAFSSLLKKNIIPDVVISIDGQSVSVNHFFDHTKKLSLSSKKLLPDSKKVSSDSKKVFSTSEQLKKQSLFVFSLSANNSAARKLIKKGYNTVFAFTGHPLEQFIYSIFPNSFLPLDTSSGTVTVAAIDFAQKQGFSSIEVLGADFGFEDGKPYAQGTYLDTLYSYKQAKTLPNETNFTKLTFRTPLIKVSETKKTTETLKSYENALFDWGTKNNYEITKKDHSFILKQKEKNTKTEKKELSKPDFKLFIQKINEKKDSQEFQNAILPFISYLKNKDSKQGITKSFNQYSIIALNFILRYTHKV